MPPRRTTLTFSSETAPDLGEAKLYVYYCCYSGQHVLTTDCDLTRAPRRKTDGAFQIDTQQHVAQLHHTQEGEEILLKRDTGLLERQFRILVGKLPFAYRSEPNGRYLYIMDNAVTTSFGDWDWSAAEASDAPPVPPCIREAPSDAEPSDGVPCTTTWVDVDLDDRAPRALFLRATSEAVRVAVKGAAGSEGAASELLELFREVLQTRSAQLAVQDGPSARRPRVSVDGMSKEEVFRGISKALPDGSSSLLPLKISKRKM